MTELRQDVRFALRMIAKNPGFSLVVILALALGIGANTAIFSVIDSVLLRPLPYPDPDRLVMVWGNFVGIGLPKDRNMISAPEFVDIRDQNRCFADVAVFAGSSYSIVAGTVPERVDGATVTAGFFTVLGVQPHLGRLFRPGDDRRGAKTSWLSATVCGRGVSAPIPVCCKGCDYGKWPVLHRCGDHPARIPISRGI